MASLEHCQNERNKERIQLKVPEAFELRQASFTMLRLLALAVFVLCLAACFDFNKTFDPPPTVTFQIVISSTNPNYGGTYVWTSQDQAYEAVILGGRYYVYMDGSGIWHLSGPNSIGASIASSTSPAYGTLPPASTSRWSGSGMIISAIDDSEGGISDQSDAPDGPVAGTLQVSSSGNSATYQWQRSSTSSFDSSVLIGTGSTYTVQMGTDYHQWIRVIVTPTDSTGTIQGTPVVSQAV